jgi:hypothetical protein
MSPRAKQWLFEWDFSNLEKLQNPKKLGSLSQVDERMEPPRQISPADIARAFSRRDGFLPNPGKIFPSKGSEYPDEVRYTLVALDDFEPGTEEATRYPPKSTIRILQIIFTIRYVYDLQNGYPHQKRYIRVVTAHRANKQTCRAYDRHWLAYQNNLNDRRRI